MRVGRAIAFTAIGLLSIAAVAFAGLQTRLGQRWLMNVVASMASSPDMRVSISGTHGYFPTNLTVDRIELADRSGVWLRIDQAHVDWAFFSLFGDRLRIDRLAAQRVDVIRAPVPSAGQPAPAASSGGGVGLPMGVDLRTIAVDEIRVRTPLAPMDSRWKLTGQASVAADTGRSAAKLLLERTDGGVGRLSIDGHYDIYKRTVSAQVTLNEGETGLIAKLVGRPDLKEVSARLVADGDVRRGKAELIVEGGDAMTSKGALTWHPDGNTTAVTLRFEAAAPGLPDSPFARLARNPLRIEGKATISDTHVEVRELTATAATLQLNASGRIGVQDQRVDGRITMAAAEAGAFRELLNGTTWRDLDMDVRVSGTTMAPRFVGRARVAELKGPDGVSVRDANVTLEGEARDLDGRIQATALVKGSAAEVAWPGVDGRALPSTRLDFSAKLALRPDGRIVVDSAELESAFASIKTSGAYLPSERSGEVKTTLNLADAATLSTLAGRKLTGRGSLDVTTRVGDGGATVEWSGTLENLSLEGVPAQLLNPAIRLSGSASARQDQSWTLKDVRIASDSASFEVTGSGKGREGNVELALKAPRLAALDKRFAGALDARASIALRPDGIAVKLNGEGTDLVHEQIRAGRLSFALDAAVRGEAISGSLNARGDLAGKDLRIDGRFARAADGSLSVPAVDAQWASATIQAKDLTITERSATGDAQLRVGDLADIGRVAGAQLAGSLELDIATGNDAPNGRVKVDMRGKGLLANGIGAQSLEAKATIDDPLGRAIVDATARATGLRGVEEISQVSLTAKGERAGLDVTVDAGGARTSAQLAAKISETATGFLVALSRATGRYAGLPVALAGASRVRIEGSRIIVEPTTLRVADGRANVAGTLDPQASDLAIDIAGLPLTVIGKIAPGIDMVGTLQTKTRVRGALAAPRIDSSFTIAGLRLRRPTTDLLPALTITGTAGLAGQRATFDTQIAAGSGGRLAVKGDAVIPSGRAPLTANATVSGRLDLGPFAPLVGSTVQGLRGTAAPNVSLRVSGDSITGQGSIAINGLALTLPLAGLRLQRGEALLRLNGDTLAIERFAASTGATPDISVSGTVSLNMAQGLPVNLQVTTNRAALVNRSDLVATVSSNLQVTGPVLDGVKVGGSVRVDRAELTIGASQVANYPTVAVREINKPGAPQQAPPPVQAARPVAKGPPRGPPVTLALTVDAPRAVFVRGRGLDAEVGGRFQVSGDASTPSVVGSLNLRRGDFNLAGKRLRFTRGNVTLIDLETIEPLLDFVASTPITGGGTAEIVISGTSRAPKIELRSTPERPADEVMAALLFGKSGAKLSPFELISAAQALAELTGATGSGGVVARIRGGLGLDRFAIDSGSDNPASVTLEAGRYIAPGIYVGAKQGATADSSRGVVEIDVFKNTKIEADVGTDSTGRLGIKMEWDY